MTKGWRQLRAGMMAGDAILVAVAYVLADRFLRCGIYMNGEPWPELIGGQVSSVRVHLKVLAFLPFAWPLILFWLGWYQQRGRSWRWMVQYSIAATAILSLLMASLALLFERELYPRSQIGFTALLLPATALAWRGISLSVGQWLGSRHPRRVLIVGTGREALRLRRLMRTARWGRGEVVGHLRGPGDQSRRVLTPVSADELVGTTTGMSGRASDAPTGAAAEPRRQASRIPDAAILGDIDRLGAILDQHVVDEVIFATELGELSALMPYVALCEEVGVPANVQAESITCHSTPELIVVHGIPMLTYAPVRHSPERLFVKRTLDILLAVIGITVTAPIMLICALLIRLSGPGAILFRQRRAGLNGRVFAMFKFRTMQPGAEERLAEVAHLNESRGPVFKSSRDPRITPVGAFLRRWSLDELPQLFNVLLGDMSIVGPRPPIPAEVSQYDRWQRRRLSMRPGLTCLWQIKGRHRVTFEEWMQLDLFYIDHWSLKLDFLIMCKTVAIVFSGSGA